ncbi:MAG: tRNA pseudouridine(55) synthase TruB [Bacteroidota bacterium]|nr:tRNA pseudouridine(55) synthase TruB [Bacteroidota bacterium]
MPNHPVEHYKDGQTFLIDKKADWTSFNVVSLMRGILKKTFNIRKLKVGHAGTLDPLATGLLIICVGKNTKKINEYVGLTKEYIADIEFGFTTPSYDMETEADGQFDYSHITKEMVEEVLQKFIGEQEQVPPIFSAKNVNGKRAYKYARSGEKVEMKSSVISIYSLEIQRFEMPRVKVKMTCSKGTYVRAFVRDFGKELNTGATMVGLRRTAIGNFSVENALSIDEFKKNI